MAKQLRMFGLPPEDLTYFRGNSIEDARILGVAQDIFPEKLRRGRNGGAPHMLCPEHDETRPSFYLRPKLNQFYCFGCGTHGGPLSMILVYHPNPLGYLEQVFSFDQNAQTEVKRLWEVVKQEEYWDSLGVGDWVYGLALFDSVADS